MGFVASWSLLIGLLMRLTAMQVLACECGAWSVTPTDSVSCRSRPVAQGEEMFSFNPFKILAIEEGATPTEIKKAYRRMSLQYHPDKNPDAGDLFVKISKAYEVLTNDATRENYEKYAPRHPMLRPTGVPRKAPIDRRWRLPSSTQVRQPGRVPRHLGDHRPAVVAYQQGQ